MLRLDDLQPNAAVRGVIADAFVTVVNVQWFGSEALELTYKTPDGKVANELLYRHDEPRLELVEKGRPWSFDGDGALFRLVSEALRIRLAHLFDPVLAVHTSVVDPLPHQITAVYESMLPRQPLRFLLADDPGAGKTIMAGLLIKELIARGDLQRCLVVCPGSLAHCRRVIRSDSVSRTKRPSLELDSCRCSTYRPVSLGAHALRAPRGMKMNLLVCEHPTHEGQAIHNVTAYTT